MDLLWRSCTCADDSAPGWPATRLTLELPEAATVEQLLGELGRRQPALAPALASALPVVEGVHADRADVLEDGAEVALLIPVAGG